MSLVGSYWPVGATTLRLTPSRVFCRHFRISGEGHRGAAHEVHGEPEDGVEEARAVDRPLLLEHLALERPHPVGQRGQDVRRAAEQAERAVVGDERHAELPGGVGDRDGALEQQLARRCRCRPRVTAFDLERGDHVGPRGEVLAAERRGAARDQDRREREDELPVGTPHRGAPDRRGSPASIISVRTLSARPRRLGTGDPDQVVSRSTARPGEPWCSNQQICSATMSSASRQWRGSAGTGAESPEAISNDSPGSIAARQQGPEVVPLQERPVERPAPGRPG